LGLEGLILKYWYIAMNQNKGKCKILPPHTKIFKLLLHVQAYYQLSYRLEMPNGKMGSGYSPLLDESSLELRSNNDQLKVPTRSFGTEAYIGQPLSKQLLEKPGWK